MKRLLRRIAPFGIGGLLIVGGALTYVFILRSMRSSEVTMPAVRVAAKPVVQVPQRIEGTPVQFDVPSLDMSLPVITGFYDDKTGQWTLTKDKVQYAAMSDLPNNMEGNTFLYGHYRKNVFAKLHKIESGAIATVKTDNGHVFYYRYVSSKVVRPTESEGIFDYVGAPILTVQTCTGALYEKRQLFTFELVRVA